MKLSFDDEESFKEIIGSLCFNNPPSDPNSETQALDEVDTLGSSSINSMLPQEMNEPEDF